MCTLGVCQATTLAGVTAATSISVDATRIYFTSSTKILACPKSGCVLAPTQLDDMGMGGYSTWAVNVTNGNLFFMSAPTQAGTEHDDLFECPLTGCPSPAPIIGRGDALRRELPGQRRRRRLLVGRPGEEDLSARLPGQLRMRDVRQHGRPC